MHVPRLRQRIDAGKGEAVLDIVQWYNFCVFDIIHDFAFEEYSIGVVFCPVCQRYGRG